MLWALLVIAAILLIWLIARQVSKSPFGNLLINKQEARLKKALKHLRQHGEITNEEYREMVKVSEAQATRDFDVLEKKGLVKQIGKMGRSVKYTLN